MGRNRNNIVTQKAPVTDKATRALIIKSELFDLHKLR